MAEEVVANKIESGLQRMINNFRTEGSNGNGDGQEIDIDISKLTDLSEDDIKEIKALQGKDLLTVALVRANDQKKFQRLSDQRLVEFNKLKETQSAEHKYKDEEVDEFLNDVRTDALTAFKKHKEKYALPDVNFLEKQVKSGGTIEDRVLQFQTERLKKDIEKEFNLEDGTFVYDAADAYNPKTPSYRFRTSSENYEKQLQDEFSQQEKTDREVLQSMLTERESQLKRLKEQYYPVDVSYEQEVDETKKAELKKTAEEQSLSAFNAKMAELDAAWDRMKKGDFTSKGNPLTVENVFRGYFFDELQKQAIEKAIRDVHLEYNKKGLFIRDDKGMPIDYTKVQGSSATESNIKKTNNPLSRLTQRYSN